MREKRYSKKAMSFLSMHIGRHMKDYDMTKKQAIAVAFAEARKKKLIK